jgi:hypothetical protein
MPNEPYFYSQGERVHLGKNLGRGTVIEDQMHNSLFVKVAPDDKPEGTVDGFYTNNLKPLTDEEIRKEYKDHLLGLTDNHSLFTILVGFNKAGSIINGKLTEEKAAHPQAEEMFRLKIGDRVKFKYDKKNGTIRSNEMAGDANVKVEWDKDDGTRWEHIVDLQVLHAPRETTNPNQELIDQIEELRRPLIIELEQRQAVLAKLTAAKKILQKG